MLLTYLPHASLLLTTLVTLTGVAYSRPGDGHDTTACATTPTAVQAIPSGKLLTANLSGEASPEPGNLPAPGTVAPDFQAVAHTGAPVVLRELRGRPVVLYFYPKDDTPGCTTEASELRDRHGALEQAGAVVIGVSTQDNLSHQAFAEKYGLPFLLLPDTDGRIAESYGVPVQRGVARRITFLVGKDGKIVRVWSAVTPAGHAQEVLDAVRSLGKD